MKKELRSLAVLTLGCTVAASIFGFGSEMFAFRAAYEGSASGTLILLTRLAVYLVLAATLVLRGGWWGVPAAIVMTVCATAVEWALFPLAFDLAAIADPAGYEEEYGSGVARPTYGRWAFWDIIGVGIAAAFARGLVMMAHVNPEGRRDE